MPNASDPVAPETTDAPATDASTRPATNDAARRFDARWRAVRIAAMVATGALALMVPWLAPNPYILFVAVIIAGYAAYAVSWNFIGGFTGYISLGHAAYAGLGGYGTALLMIHTGLSPWVSLALGALGTAALAVPIGIASLRVRGASFVIVSIALVLILLLVAQSLGDITRGSEGLRVPRPFGPEVMREQQHERFYFIYLAVIAVALLLWWAIDRSQFGAGLKAIREDEDKAQSLGVPTFRYKLIVFVISAFFTALAGGLYALWFGNLDPVFQFSILLGSYMVLMSLFGGLRSLFGPVLGAVVVGYAMEVFKAYYGDTQLHLVGLGLLLGLVVLFMPEGVLPWLDGFVKRFRPASTSIREETAADLRARNQAMDERRGAGSVTITSDSRTEDGGQESSSPGSPDAPDSKEKS